MNIDSETTLLKSGSRDRGLTWIVKQSNGDNIYLGSNFGTSYKLESILDSENPE